MALGPFSSCSTGAPSSGSHGLRGNPLPGRSASTSSRQASHPRISPTLYPFSIHRNQPFQPRVIPGAGISPVQRIIHISTFDRIVVQVIQFLNHNLFSGYLLWVAAFLPKLVFTVYFVNLLVLSELSEQSRLLCLYQMVNDLPGRKRLEITDLFWKVGVGCDEVQMVLQNDVAVKVQSS